MAKSSLQVVDMDQKKKLVAKGSLSKKPKVKAVPKSRALFLGLTLASKQALLFMLSAIFATGIPEKPSTNSLAGLSTFE